MLLPIIHYGNPVLRQRGETVARFDAELAAFVRDLLETMVAGEGIGLAAQQVGHARRVFVADLQTRADEAGEFLLDGKTLPPALLFPLVVVNPQIEYLPGPTRKTEEGCLSFPGLRGRVERPSRVRLRYQDAQGQPHTLEATGLLARVLQHEFDHVEGVLFIDRMEETRVAELEPQLKALKKQTRAGLRAKAG